jgi:hypothetical protein
VGRLRLLEWHWKGTWKDKEIGISMSDRILGTIAMICAPALLIEELLRQGQENALITGVASMVFMAGWICSNTGMRRMRPEPENGAVLQIQLLGLALAFMFDLFEAAGLLGRESIVFNITDVAPEHADSRSPTMPRRLSAPAKPAWARKRGRSHALPAPGHELV